jgi:hypothetical protein
MNYGDDIQHDFHMSSLNNDSQGRLGNLNVNVLTLSVPPAVIMGIGAVCVDAVLRHCGIDCAK